LRTFDDESLAYVGDYYQRADAFLFGRRTYEMFAWSWGTGTWGSDQGDNPISTALNSRPKYVASTTLTDPAWANTTVLSGDLASAIRELKNPPGGELQMHGSGALALWLLANDLVDELTLLVCPVIVGQPGALACPWVGAFIGSANWWVGSTHARAGRQTLRMAGDDLLDAVAAAGE
jgi:dihydrofolate reductase